MLGKRLLSVALTLAMLAGPPMAADAVRVACVGDSITYGAGIRGWTNTYPAQRGRLRVVRRQQQGKTRGLGARGWGGHGLSPRFSRMSGGCRFYRRFCTKNPRKGHDPRQGLDLGRRTGRRPCCKPRHTYRNSIPPDLGSVKCGDEPRGRELWGLLQGRAGAGNARLTPAADFSLGQQCEVFHVGTRDLPEQLMDGVKCLDDLLVVRIVRRFEDHLAALFRSAG